MVGTVAEQTPPVEPLGPDPHSSPPNTQFLDFHAAYVCTSGPLAHLFDFDELLGLLKYTGLNSGYSSLGRLPHFLILVFARYSQGG